MGRKRPRSRTALTDDDDGEQVGPIDESESAHEPDDNERHDVWDAFKEEHHEVLEQLPLSLHRQYTLMRELDAQGEVLHVDILDAVRRYIHLREGPDRLEQVRRDTTTTTDGGDVHAAAHDAMGMDGAEPAPAPGPPAYEVQPGESRALLQHIAQTSEEAIRTAEEKVSIAQTAYETVDRHIRLLNQAIKEQEAAISLGVRPGTHLAPILLPDLVVPRWARPPRVEHSPVPSLSPEAELYMEEPAAPAPKAAKKGKKVAAPKLNRAEKEETPLPVVSVDGEEPPVAGRMRRTTAVRLTLPPQPGAGGGPPVAADPNEARYCYCHQVSFGTMIACDNEGECDTEWFHFECTGLVEVPSKKTKWYCRNCKPKMMQKGRSKM